MDMSDSDSLLTLSNPTSPARKHGYQSHVREHHPNHLSKEVDPSVFSDAAVQPVYPPQTVLVRWKDELLLLDAWEPHGRGLRTPPSLISEALAHFSLGLDVAEYRLAIRERVDGVPRLLFLGISALRFVEDGRVLELRDVSSLRNKDRLPLYHPPSNHRRQRSTETIASSRRGASHDTRDQESQSPTSTSTTFTSEDHPSSLLPTPLLQPSTADAVHLSTTSSRKEPSQLTESSISPPIIRSHAPAPSHISAPRSPALPKISNKSSATLVEGRNPHTGSSMYIYVHPKYGALFAHLGPGKSGRATSNSNSSSSGSSGRGSRGENFKDGIDGLGSAVAARTRSSDALAEQTTVDDVSSITSTTLHSRRKAGHRSRGSAGPVQRGLSTGMVAAVPDDEAEGDEGAFGDGSSWKSFPFDARNTEGGSTPLPSFSSSATHSPSKRGRYPTHTHKRSTSGSSSSRSGGGGAPALIPQARSQSRGSSSSGIRSLASHDRGDLWLGAEGMESWEHELRERVRRANDRSHSRGRSYESLPRPRLSSRSTSDGTTRTLSSFTHSDRVGRPANSRMQSTHF